MNWTNCGSVIRKGQKFCGKCGTMVSGEHIEQKDTFYVRKLPMVMIVLLTLGLIITSFTMESGSMTVAMGISFIQAIILISFIILHIIRKRTTEKKLRTHRRAQLF